MKRRTARHGQNAGNLFWGCSSYPECRQIIDISTQSSDVKLDRKHDDTTVMVSAIKQPKPERERLPVSWREPILRPDFDSEYVSVGSLAGLVRRNFWNDETVRKLLCDSLILSRQDRADSAVDEHSSMVSAVVLKILQRGHMPLPTLQIERDAIDAFGRSDKIKDLSKTAIGELGWEHHSGGTYDINRNEFISRLTEKRPFKLESDFRDPLFDSPRERDFITRWVTDNLGDAAAHWIYPQAPLDVLLTSSPSLKNTANFTDNRVDFIVHAPWMDPFAVEIDGPDHLDDRRNDSRRDRAIKRATNIDVIRVENRELDNFAGPNLDQINNRFGQSIHGTQLSSDRSSTSGHKKIADFARDCANGSKIQFVIAQAVKRGWLSGDEWNLKIAGGGSATAGAVLDVLRMYSALDSLYDGTSAPKICRLRTEKYGTHAWLKEKGAWLETEYEEFDEADLNILVEPDSSPFDRIVQLDFDFIIRPAFLPVEFSLDLHSAFPRKPIVAESFDAAEPALTFFLQNVFRKQAFRDGQGNAIWRTLRQQDTVVLLPTGGGKSIIYQLSGLLMPGITMVIDPIVALIEDQIEVLQRYGIDRATGITSALGRADREVVMKRAERGEFQFILMAPERLQSSEFRGTIRSLRSSNLVNLAVIDEAHCVSEWGHDFRPSYLRLADTLRDCCADQFDNAPPLLALTGTASRAVLKDMMIELGIDQSRSDNVVRPTTFNRPELKYKIRREKTTKAGMDVLRGELQQMPQQFGKSNARFFSPQDRETSSGIVFVRSVRSRDWGLIATQEAVANVAGNQVAIYSGGTGPDGSSNWEVAKREHARQFKENEVPVLVATNAFGMGIDKPNIRYVVHNGMPGSIESFYQEAGRAGRDGRDAWCVVVTSEFDRRRSDRLLDLAADISDLRTTHSLHANDWSAMDCITSAVYFHLSSFSGIAAEAEQATKVLNQLGDLSHRGTININANDAVDQEKIEKAIVRLVRSGIVDDYTIHWSKQSFELDVPQFDYDACTRKIIEHVKLAQPSRSRDFEERISRIPNDDPIGTAIDLVRVLIEFTYDVIERSRRRAMREAFNLARNAHDDQAIRRRILEYLQEGVHAERIDELLDSADDNLDAWREIIEKMQTAVDAGELRGIASRSLESYPDTPGLLFMRAASEAMCSDRDDRVCIENFSLALSKGITYLAQPQGMCKMIFSLYEFAEARAPELDPLLTISMLELESNQEQHRTFRKQAYKHAKESQNIETKAVGATLAMNDAIDAAADSVNALRNRYTEKSLSLLGRRGVDDARRTSISD